MSDVQMLTSRIASPIILTRGTRTSATSTPLPRKTPLNRNVTTITGSSVLRTNTIPISRMVLITSAQCAENKSTSDRLYNNGGKGGEEQCGYTMLMDRLNAPPRANVALGSNIGLTSVAHTSGQRTVLQRAARIQPMMAVMYNTVITGIGTSSPFANPVTGSTGKP